MEPFSLSVDTSSLNNALTSFFTVITDRLDSQVLLCGISSAKKPLCFGRMSNSGSTRKERRSCTTSEHCFSGTVANSLRLHAGSWANKSEWKKSMLHGRGVPETI